MIQYYRNRNLGFQLRTVMTVCLLIAFSSIAALVYQNASKVLLNTTLKEQQSKIQAMGKTIEGQYNAYLETARILASTLRNGYLEGFYVEDNEVNYNGYQIRDITIWGESIVSDVRKPEAFSRDTGAAATIFAPVGDDWIRISTSLRDSEGKLEIGTLLGKEHPAYNNIMNGQPYYSVVTLLGRNYIAYYDPVLSDEGKVTAITSIALPVEDATQSIFESLRSVSWGDTGYTIVLDNQQTNLGHYLLHPKFKPNDPTILDVADYNGDKPFKAIFSQDTGILTYPWEFNGSVGEKYIVYTTVPGWDWKILGGTFVSEVTKESTELLKLIAIISLVVGALTFVIMSLFINRSTKPLTTLSGYMERLGEGEVSIKVDQGSQNSQNEVTRLTNSVSNMANRLNSLVGDIRSTSDQLDGQSSSVLTDAQTNLRQSDAQQRQAEQVVTAIEEMATSAKSVAQQVEAIAENVRQADESTQTGLGKVEEVCLDVAQLNDQLDQSAKAIEQVNNDSNSIQSVTKMIDDIAEQTNLLALNAAIEAARAGEQGRGFAVVADEVRTLAARTQMSVKDVVQIINQLKSSTDNAVSLMHQSQQNANKVLDKAQEAGTSLESIAEQVRGIAGQAEAIATTAEQQAQVSQEVAASASEISDLNVQSRETSAQTSDSAQQLSELSKHLKQQVDFFH
ncbi:methyl-accepting chemotaxis protein [Vibrio diazotrophicus]|uniref:methyl-accepting chemotaxis protein n=1 Tax=Vibrio diazotrophicus TaxID=685 RepID=UPI000C9E13AC|nr:Cache 3/Cache 2 fusion domain-containing protein [Vibrio diazotrophicus]PNH89084.1 methyl-accepting chemotaxis protein [Vibrio diazotrophicus]